MSMFRVISFTLILLLSVLSVKGQDIRSLVLEKGVVDSLFVFGKWNGKGQTETHLKYLGQVKTKTGQIFKIVNSSWYRGLAHRATSRILIFNERNQYVGNYCVTMVGDLPAKLQDGKLIFNNTDEDCDTKLVTTVSFKNGLPKQFFRRCKGEFGDIYQFEAD